jgi:hypothetical protein
MPLDKVLAFYARQGAITEPGSYSFLFEPLPGDVASLCSVIHGAMALDFWIGAWGLAVAEERRAEVNLRTSQAKMERMLQWDERPLAMPRPFEKRLFGNCRDLCLLLCAILRHKGVPARVRSGFATFFHPQRRFDHWLCEYWTTAEERWIMVDPWMSQIQQEKEQLDPALRVGLAEMDYDPLDVRPGYFLTGGLAWQRCRRDGEDADQYGTYGDLQGLWFIRDNMLRDLLCLNKLEVLPWDCWGPLAGKEHAPQADELAWLDRAAALTRAGDEAFDDLRAMYEQTPSLHLPAANA